MVVADDFLLQLGCARQGVLVDLQHVLVWDAVGGGVEIAGVGQQEAQRVADAAVGIHHAGQDLVVDAQVARVVGRSHPQTDDFGAHLVRYVLRRHGVADGLGHLLALAVHGEAVGQQTLVRGAAEDGRSQQQRRVEPAAVLVMAFQVQIGFGALVVVHIGVGAAHHMPEGGAESNQTSRMSVLLV